MKIIFFLALLWINICKENFTYALTDTLVIQNGTFIEIANSILTHNNEYVDPEQILLNTSFQLVMNSDATNSTYNLYYFKLNEQDGVTCYENWIQNKGMKNVVSCNQKIQSSCTKYINCGANSVSSLLDTTALTRQYIEGLIFLQNPNQNNITIKTASTFQMLASNGWFFGGVALICALLLNIVIFSGLAFYWSLKYKKTKKQFEQFKLMNNS